MAISRIAPRSRAWARRSFIGGLGLFSVVLAGCAQPAAPAPAVPPRQVIEGTVAWRERIALPPEAELQVSLNDVSRMDAPAVMLAEQRIRLAGRQAPVPFRLDVDAARLDPRKRYVVAARVVVGGALFFINDTAYPVLTQGAGKRVDMTLVRVQR